MLYLYQNFYIRLLSNDLNCRLNGIADDHDLTDLTDGQFEALKQIWNDGYCSGIAYAKSCVDKLIKKE